MRAWFWQYFASLFKDYDRYFTRPSNVLAWDFREVFDQKAFIEANDIDSDFYKDFFQTRTWMVFLEAKIAPETVEQVQTVKHFDEWIQNLDFGNLYNVSSSYFPNSPFEEKEEFEYLFAPEKYFHPQMSLQAYYMSSLDTNDVKIEQWVKTIEIQE